MIELQDVHKTYDTGTIALNGISMKIDDGEFVFLVGPSGSGKSTIIKILTAELRPTSGSALVNGFAVEKLRSRAVPYLRRTLGVIFQDFRLISDKSVYENVAFAMRVIGAPEKEIQKRIDNKQKNHPIMPTSDHWMLTYETLDAVMKNIKNPDYYAMPSQANQQVLRKVLKDWKSHFELLASYRQNPGKFKAQPKQPGYIRTPYTTVTFTNQVAKRSDIKGKMHITFPRCLVPLCVGKPEGSYVRTEVKPCYSGYMVYVTFQDAVKMPEAPTNPTRILGLDPGLDNFLTALTNFPAAPFIIDGHWLKSINQNFNRRRAALIDRKSVV